MRKIVIPAAVLLTVAAGLGQVTQDQLGRSVKLRILVDKVMQPERDWTTEEWMVKETADAGFNVFSPRRGHEDLAAVRQVTEWCAKYGIFHMPWMRGTLEAPADDRSKGKRMVWAGGSEQTLWSPNADEFWAWTTEYIVQYAELSATMPNLIGVFLDYENYSKGGEGNCYDLSYDDDILARFAAAQGVTIPPLANRDRKPWLVEQGLHDAFAAFQVDLWRQRCRELRQAVDRHNPKFQFCIYPAPGTKFMVEACYPEWSTEAAPIILADPWVYGRPSRFLPQAEALEANLRKLQEGMAIPQQAGIPFIYSGGIDPVVQGADPEFCGKNAVMISELTGGYWVFYEGPKYTVDHPAYFKWFTWANQAIEAARWAAWREPRVEPEDFSLTIFGEGGQGKPLVAPPTTGQTVDYPLVKLRGENLLLVAVRAGQPVEIVLRNHQVGRYVSLLAWELRGPDLQKIASGTIPHEEEGSVTFTPERDGIALLGASAGSCAYQVVRSDAPIGLLAGDGLGLIMGAERLYFAVPAGLERFTLRARGQGLETVKLTVYGPDGTEVATGQTTPEENDLALAVEVGAHGPGTWSVQVGKADTGVLEDSRLTLDPALPPTLSLRAEEVFAQAGGEG